MWGLSLNGYTTDFCTAVFPCLPMLGTVLWTNYRMQKRIGEVSFRKIGFHGKLAWLEGVPPVSESGASARLAPGSFLC